MNTEINKSTKYHGRGWGAEKRREKSQIRPEVSGNHYRFEFSLFIYYPNRSQRYSPQENVKNLLVRSVGVRSKIKSSRFGEITVKYWWKEIIATSQGRSRVKIRQMQKPLWRAEPTLLPRWSFRMSPSGKPREGAAARLSLLRPRRATNANKRRRQTLSIATRRENRMTEATHEGWMAKGYFLFAPSSAGYSNEREPKSPDINIRYIYVNTYMHTYVKVYPRVRPCGTIVNCCNWNDIL